MSFLSSFWDKIMGRGKKRTQPAPTPVVEPTPVPAPEPAPEPIPVPIPEPVPAPVGEMVIFTDFFESGLFTGLANFYPDSVTLDATSPIGIAAKFHYEIQAVEQGHVDRNRSVARECVFQQAPENALENFAVYGDVYFGFPYDPLLMIQRKLLYIKGDYRTNQSWRVILTSWAHTLEIHYGDDAVLTTGYTTPPQIRHTIRLGIKLNTPGQSDGIITLRADGYERTWTGLSIRAGSTNKLEAIEWGTQVDRTMTGVRVLEDRWWKNLKLTQVN